MDPRAAGGIDQESPAGTRRAQERAQRAGKDERPRQKGGTGTEDQKADEGTVELRLRESEFQAADSRAAARDETNGNVEDGRTRQPGIAGSRGEVARPLENGAQGTGSV